MVAEQPGGKPDVSILDKQLVHSINSGRALMLVGSGPSTAAGLPSWTALAEAAIQMVVETRPDLVPALESLKAANRLPDVFEGVAAEVGIDALCAKLAGLLMASGADVGPVYPVVAGWPVASYLTTNFDDLLLAALHQKGEAFVSRGNSLEELRELRADTSGMVFKLHGHLGACSNVVLTSAQYHDFAEGPSRRYWRDIVFSILRTMDVLIVGYSVSDPNFQDQLEWAKSVSAPNKPVYLFATGFSETEIDELYAKFNIRVLAYENPDGEHRELVRVLKRYDPFIARRHSRLLGLAPVDEDQARIAGSLYVFTKARVEDEGGTCLQRVYCAVVLSALSDLGLGSPTALGALAAMVRVQVGSTLDPPTLDRSVEQLHQRGYVDWNADDSTVRLLVAGAERIAATTAERRGIEERFEVACRVYLAELPEPLDEDSQSAVIAGIRRGIVAAFERRGLEIAKSVFIDTPMNVSDASDILSVINDYGSSLGSLAERSAFADLTIKILLEPGQEMKAYLASMSQGYFAYHTLGWDSAATDERLALARQNVWVVDTSILLSLLAAQCVNHRYAHELLSRMSELEFRYLTTERLLDEVEGHARWAITEYVGKGLDSLELLKAVVESPGHGQNLFVQGFASWAEGRGIPSLAQYLEECIGTSKTSDLRVRLVEKLEVMGIKVRGFEEWPSVVGNPAVYADRDELAAEIRIERQRRGTYKKDDQCTAEAEVILLARTENAAFLTLSTVLRGLAGADHRVNWQPEALYRFLSLFSTRVEDPETLYESMTQTFYFCGFDIVDRDSVSRFASGLAHQARIQLSEARHEYSAALDDRDFGDLIEDFETVPDEQKPFYAMQFAHYVAVRATARAAAAERRVAVVENRAKLDDRETAELTRLRAIEARRQAKAKKVSRRNQSKPKKGKRH
jgi:hypothetical protein